MDGEFAVSTIHSDMTTAERKAADDAIGDCTPDVLINVQALGEGFDMPALTVATYFCRPASMVPFMQFVGRVLRAHQPTCPHPNSGQLHKGYVIAHRVTGMQAHWAKMAALDTLPIGELVPSVLKGYEVPNLTSKDAVVRGQQWVVRQELGTAQETMFPL